MPTTTTVRLPVSARNSLTWVASQRRVSVSKLLEAEAERMRREEWYRSVRAAATGSLDEVALWEASDVDLD